MVKNFLHGIRLYLQTFCDAFQVAAVRKAASKSDASMAGGGGDEAAVPLLPPQSSSSLELSGRRCASFWRRANCVIMSIGMTSSRQDKRRCKAGGEFSGDTVESSVNVKSGAEPERPAIGLANGEESSDLAPVKKG